MRRPRYSGARFIVRRMSCITAASGRVFSTSRFSSQPRRA
jgi:hypothetical protein